jgi:hypothetical protein
MASFKLFKAAGKIFLPLKGYRLLPDVYEGKQFVNGVLLEKNVLKERLPKWVLHTY